MRVLRLPGPDRHRRADGGTRSRRRPDQRGPVRPGRLTAEHRHVEAVLEEAAAGTPADPGWPGRLIAALGLLRQHILREQDGVFPAALASLATSDWEAIEQVRTRAGSALPGPLAARR